MTFPRQRWIGLWIDNSVVDALEFETFDQNISDALDGAAGGAYAPSAVLEIGGDGLEVTTLFVSSGNTVIGSSVADGLTVNALTFFEEDAQFNDGASFLGPASFAQPVNFTDDVTLGNTGADLILVEGTLSVSGITDFQDFVQFANDANFVGNVTLGSSGSDLIEVDGVASFGEVVDFNDLVQIASGGELTCAGPANFNNTVNLGNASGDIIDVTGTITLRTRVAYAGVGRVPKRVTVGVDSDASYGIKDWDEVQVLPASLAATRNYTIDDTGAVDGDIMTFTNLDVTNSINVKRPDTTTILIVKNASSFVQSGRVIRRSGVWVLLNGTPNP